MRAVLAAALLLGCAEPPPEYAPAVRDCRLRVSVELPGVPARVGLVGPGLEPSRHALTRDGDVWRGDFALPPGRVLYQIDADGRRLLDAGNPLSANSQGEEWSLATVESCDSPAFYAAEIEVGPRSLSAFVVFERVVAEDGLADAVVTLDGRPHPGSTFDEHGVRLRLEGVPPGKHRLRVTGIDAAGRAARPFEAPFWSDEAPFHWEDALVYQVVVDRFAADAPFGPAERARPPGRRAGGHLRGLRAVLESGYFDRLGVNVLWISPLNTNPEGLFAGVEGGAARYEGYHGYWPVAPRAVEPSFGTEEDVEALVQAAHARGIRVLMDVVLNHVHEEHPYFDEHPDWFNPHCVCGTASCPWWSHIERCWFTPYLGDISFDRPESLDAQVDDAAWWMDRFDLDGLRVDAVPMMPRFVTRRLADRVRRQFEGLGARHFLLGETFTGPEGHALVRWYLGPDGLDGQFDFPLMWAVRAVFAWESAPLWTLDDVLTASRAAWAGSGAVMGSFVGNHDVTRFLSEAARQIRGTPGEAWDAPPPVPDDPVPYARMLLAQAFVLTIPGAPVLFYGDEFGLPGAGDPDNRRPMRFGAERSPHEQALQAQIERLGRLRRCLPALRRGDLQTLRVEKDRYAYLRDAGDGEPAIVALNRAAQAAELRLPVDAVAPGAFVEALTGARAEVESGELRAVIGPRAPAVWVRAESRCWEGPR